MIEYDKLKEFMKIGKIPSDIISKVKSSVDDDSRPSVYFGGRTSSKPNLFVPNASTPKSIPLPLISEEHESNKEPEEKQEIKDPARLKMISRAVVVIKKASMQNIPRSEVVSFLTQKGMNESDIELAYSTAQEEVMSPDERIKYLTARVKDHKTAEVQQKQINQYLSEQMATQNQEVQILRALLTISTDQLCVSNLKTAQEMVSKSAANELTLRIQKVYEFTL